VSWFEALPSTSIAMLEAAALTRDSCVIDIGGGESSLVDYLIERGVRCLTVLDVSTAALERARARLGDAASIPVWIAADVTGEWTVKPVDVWHDRAAFHFLTRPEDRARYVAHLKASVKRGGAVIIATFAPEGPATCSGLPVMRYSPEALALELGDEFRRVEAVRHEHRTPWGSVQPFTYVRFVRISGDPTTSAKAVSAPPTGGSIRPT
jgi:hypothetical protein